MHPQFINLKYRPKPTDVVCDFYVEPAKAAAKIAAESSVGIWDDIPAAKMHYAAQVYKIENEKGGAKVKIAYHHELFEDGNVPQLLSSIAGNIFGMKDVENVRLNDIHIPKIYASSFKGPSFGVAGIRKI